MQTDSNRQEQKLKKQYEEKFQFQNEQISLRQKNHEKHLHEIEQEKNRVVYKQELQIKDLTK
jgi:hypothetical protein